MARTLHKLSDAYAKSDRLNAGRHSDGGGLYLNVSPTGAKSWLFMWTVVVAKADGRKGQKRHEMGLGSYPAVSLADARALANNHRQTVAAGGNPIAERDREAEPTFADATNLFLASMERAGATKSTGRNGARRWKPTARQSMPRGSRPSPPKTC
jgi:hypothetical protein